jgi:hypothetical protein
MAHTNGEGGCITDYRILVNRYKKGQSWDRTVF